MKVDLKEFFHNRPYCVDSAIGFVAQLGLDEHLRERDELIADFKNFLSAPEVSAAWESYERDWLTIDERLLSRFPRWYDVDGRLNFVLASEIMGDYTNIVQNVYKEHVGWQQVDHVCAFIMRVQSFRMRQERDLNLARWTMADHWAVSYVLYELLHWMQVKYQYREIVSIKTADSKLALKVFQALASPPDCTQAPVIRSQAPPRSSWAWLRFWARQ